MQNTALKISEDFRKMAVKAILSILLFLSTYLLLILMAFALIALCALIGYWLITIKVMFITLMLAIGLVSLGFLILFFLIKFMFSKQKTDRSHLLEIKEKDQPDLFQFIREIVEEVQTNFPKKIYISAEVNAAVFYDSSFWSMFFPVKKNLQIGLGLLNAVSIQEFKAILAHEFGHFSQRSMKVGSYVYNVNMIIYNMLYNNDTYQSMMQRWANVSSYFAIFVNLAIKIITGIQAILKKVYTIVNLSYMSLSREMEFHADAVAAHVTGSQPLISSLLRFELADQSLNTVYNYYNTKIALSEKTNNFYPLQYFVMNFLAEIQNMPVENGLPLVTTTHYKKFNKSKLVLKDQWSSHPSTEDRISRLLMLNQPAKNGITGIATTLLTNAAELQERVTEKSFSTVTFNNEPTVHNNQEFINDFIKEYKENSFPKVYNGYFDYREPYTDFDPQTIESSVATDKIEIEKLFDDEVMDILYTFNSITADITILEQIYSGNTAIESFDYDGQKYTSSNCYMLITHLKEEMKILGEALYNQDAEIYNAFYILSIQNQTLNEFNTKYFTYKEVKQEHIAQQDSYNKLTEAVQFMHISTPHTAIESYLVQVRRHEPDFKRQIELLLEKEVYLTQITEDLLAYFKEYLSKDLKYYASKTYFNEEVDLLFAVLHGFYYVTKNTNIKTKLSILNFQAAML